MSPQSSSALVTIDDAARVTDEVTIGILAALPVEGAAIARLIDDLRPFQAGDDPSTYRIGQLPSSDPARPHRVALAVLPRDGTRYAAMMCTNLLRTFPGVRCVIMMGIAGGIPRPNEPAKHVRLGDVVVATAGIVDYGHVRLTDGKRSLRRSEGQISSQLLRAARELQFSEAGGDRPWERWLDPQLCEQARDYPRPPEETDQLNIRGAHVPHPDRLASGHPPNGPKIHYGAVASSDVLMRDEVSRDELAQEFDNLVAMEMEGSGIAASTAGHDVPWFMVRGVTDYCDNIGKNDIWHPNASYTTAAYVRALLEVCRPFVVQGMWPVSPGAPVQPFVSHDNGDRIVALLRRVHPLERRAMREIWDAAAPHLPDPPPGVMAVPENAFRYLSDWNANSDGLPPALVYVEELADHLQDAAALAADLHHWAYEHARRMFVHEALVRRRERPVQQAKPCLLIQITLDGIDTGCCRIMSWIQDRIGPWRPRQGPGEPKCVARDDAEGVVGDLVDRAEQEWHGGPVAIEFLLPTGLLDLPVEFWRPRSGSYWQPPLCVDYQVVVRSLDRMRHIDRPRMWINRWNTLVNQSSATKVHWGADPLTEDELTAWDVDLRSDETRALAVLSGPPKSWPGRDELDIALRAGVPVILWDRRDRRTADGTETLQSLVGGDPTELPSRIRKLRSAAVTAPPAEQETHPGRVVVLLWDDPSRIVAMWRAEE